MWGGREREAWWRVGARTTVAVAGEGRKEATPLASAWAPPPRGSSTAGQAARAEVFEPDLDRISSDSFFDATYKYMYHELPPPPP